MFATHELQCPACGFRADRPDDYPDATDFRAELCIVLALREADGCGRLYAELDDFDQINCAEIMPTDNIECGNDDCQHFGNWREFYVPMRDAPADYEIMRVRTMHARKGRTPAELERELGSAAL